MDMLELLSRGGRYIFARVILFGMALFKFYKVKGTNTSHSKPKNVKFANVDGNNRVHISIKLFRHHECSKLKDKRSQKKTSEAT